VTHSSLTDFDFSEPDSFLYTHCIKTFLTPLVRIDEDLPSAREQPSYLTYVKIDVDDFDPLFNEGYGEKCPIVLPENC